MAASFTHRLQRRSNHLRLIICHSSPIQLSKKFLKRKKFWDFSSRSGTRRIRKIILICPYYIDEVAGVPSWNIQLWQTILFLPHHMWSPPWKQEECELTGPASRAQHPISPRVSLPTVSVTDLCGILSLTDLSFHAKLLSVQPTQLMPVLYFSQFSLLHPQLCWLLSTQERQNSWGNSQAVENFWKCFEPTQPEESIQRKTGKGE